MGNGLESVPLYSQGCRECSKGVNRVPRVKGVCLRRRLSLSRGLLPRLRRRLRRRLGFFLCLISRHLGRRKLFWRGGRLLERSREGGGGRRVVSGLLGRGVRGGGGLFCRGVACGGEGGGAWG